MSKRELLVIYGVPFLIVATLVAAEGLLALPLAFLMCMVWFAGSGLYLAPRVTWPDDPA